MLNYLTEVAAVIPYVDPAKDKNDGDLSSTIGTTLPMAAVRNHQLCQPLNPLMLLRCSREISECAKIIGPDASDSHD